MILLLLLLTIIIIIIICFIIIEALEEPSQGAAGAQPDASRNFLRGAKQPKTKR